MQNDLMEASAAIDWVDERITAFLRTTATWLDQNITITRRTLELPESWDPLVGEIKEPLPLSFNVEVGAYLNTLRSSLDLLATAVIKRCAPEYPEDKIFFPIAKNEKQLVDPKSPHGKFLGQLSARDRFVIQQFHPHKDGNKFLWGLHRLDNARKHRRLLNAEIGAREYQISIPGFDIQKVFRTIATGSVSTGHEVIFGLLSKEVKEYHAKLKPQMMIVHSDETIEWNRSVDRTFSLMISECRSLVSAFDYDYTLKLPYDL